MAAPPVLSTLTGNWWVWFVRGVFALLFGLVAFAMPGLALLTLVVLFGSYALCDGLAAFWVAGALVSDEPPRKVRTIFADGRSDHLA